MGDLNFDDFLRRLEAIKHMGSIEDLVEHVSDELAEFVRDVDFSFEDLEPIERILRAMTSEERFNPDLLTAKSGLSRRERIAAAVA